MRGKRPQQLPMEKAGRRMRGSEAGQNTLREYRRAFVGKNDWKQGAILFDVERLYSGWQTRARPSYTVYWPQYNICDPCLVSTRILPSDNFTRPQIFLCFHLGRNPVSKHQIQPVDGE